MIELGATSRIGFGCYRITSKDPEHRLSLRHAIDSGCTLIDTATAYGDGESETIVGDVLRESKAEVFVVSKAGYAKQGNAYLREAAFLEDGTSHCLHPSFLNEELDQSSRRLRRENLDAYLLHNPEYSFRIPQRNARDFYDRLSEAFQFLERSVEAGRIRYYGISSNRLTTNPLESGAIDLPRVLQAASQISAKNHFKILEFPFNFAEQGARSRCPVRQISVFEAAKANGLSTIANRPLNAVTSEGIVRIALRPAAPPDERTIDDQWNQCCRIMQEQVSVIGLSGAPEDLEICRILRDRRSLTHIDSLEMVMNHYFYPFLTDIYGGTIPDSHRQIYATFHALLTDLVLDRMNCKARAIHRQMVADGTVDPNDGRPLPVIACDSYLRQGVDRVLVGMRRRSYVDQLKGLFHLQLEVAGPVPQHGCRCSGH